MSLLSIGVRASCTVEAAVGANTRHSLEGNVKGTPRYGVVTNLKKLLLEDVWERIFS